MSWGDSWGSTPCHNARTLAKAFYEGRERKFGNSYTKIEEYRDEVWIEYCYNGAVIAKHTPEGLVPRIVARRLITGQSGGGRTSLQFRCHFSDKGLARHLKALGIDAQWQSGNLPFLVFGAEAPSGWHSMEELKALPKWAAPAPKPRRESRFINLTMPLFA